MRNIDGLNINIWENDIAIIKVKNGSTLPCSKRSIWPACLPHPVSKIKVDISLMQIISRSMNMVGGIDLW